MPLAAPSKRSAFATFVERMSLDILDFTECVLGKYASFLFTDVLAVLLLQHPHFSLNANIHEGT